MTRHSFAIPAFLISVVLASPRAGQAQTFRVETFNIGGEGGTDYLTAEPGTGRVFVSRGTHVMVVDGSTGKVLGDIPDTPRTHGIALEDNAPEGAASDGKGKIFVNNEGKSTIQVIDVRAMNVLASWPLAPCEGPTGIAYDRATNRIFSGCGKTSVVVDPASGKVVATIANGDGVDALGWDASQKLIYIPAGRDSNVTVVHQDSPDKYTVVATVATMRGAKTISVDTQKHVAYLFQPEYGPLPPGTPPPQPGARPQRGPVIGAWFFAISH